MAEFVVKLADERGRIQQRVESGASIAELRERFSHQGFLVCDVQPRGLLTSGEATGGRRKRVSLDEFVIFNSQFLTLIKAGLPILTALELLSAQQKNENFRAALEDVRHRVKGGEPISVAFAAQGIASRIYHTTLLAGEKSGNLEEVLARYIGYQRISMSFRKKLLASLVYPALLVTAMLVLFAVLVLYVVPKFAELYSSLNATLPPITQFMLDLGTTSRVYVPFAIVGLVVAVFLFWRWSRTASGAEYVDNVRMKLPLLGPIWSKYQIAMFARMLSTLLSGGLPLVHSLETAGSSMESPVVAKAVSLVGERVREGRPLAASMQETGAFPELAVGMVTVGESTGALPQMLNSVAEFYEEDVQTALSAALALIEPLVLITMGTVVATVLISLYLPIFQLGSQAGAGSGVVR